MHRFAGPDDGINRTGLNTQRATDAPRFVNDGNSKCPLLTTLGVERQHGPIQGASQRRDGSVATRRAAIDLRRARRQRLGVGPARGITTTGALGLRQ